MHQRGILQQQAADGRDGQHSERSPRQEAVGRREEVARTAWHRRRQERGEDACRDDREGRDQRRLGEVDPARDVGVLLVHAQVQRQQGEGHAPDENPEAGRTERVVAQHVGRDGWRRRADARADDAEHANEDEEDAKCVAPEKGFA